MAHEKEKLSEEDDQKDRRKDRCKDFKEVQDSVWQNSPFTCSITLIRKTSPSKVLAFRRTIS